MRKNNNPGWDWLILNNNLLNDLRCTTPVELSYRLWEALLKKSGLQRRIFSPCPMSDREVLKAFGNKFQTVNDLVWYLRERKGVRFFFQHDNRAGYGKLLNELLPGERATLLEKAKMVMDHRFYLMGRQYTFGEKIDWHCAGEGKRWPMAHWTILNADGGGIFPDVRPLWELNRHQHFLVLGRAYWWTGNDIYAGEFVSQLKSWLSENPPEMGINWQSNLEIAIRSISWLWAFHFFLHSEVLDDRTLFEWVKAFIHSARHLERHMSYSRYCMRNNHLIGDAAGLALIAQTFPELTRAGLWKKKALKVLRTELPRQVYPDGANWEQSVVYHRFVLYLYLMVFHMEQLNGGEASSVVWGYIEKMFNYLFWLARPDGSAPMVGDSDDGRAVVLGDEPPGDLRPAISTGAVMFGRGDFKYSASKLSEEAIWLTGLEAAEKWVNLPGKKTGNGFQCFPDGGYYIVRSGWDPQDNYILYKNGPHSPYHAHADQLHVEFYSFGKDLLMDPGTFVYNGSPRWRDYFRGTSAHNTVMVDGQHQSVPNRSFRWVNPARPLKVEYYAGQMFNWVRGGHTGYCRLKDPVTHRRGILDIMSEYAVILDDFSSRERHGYEFLFHFPPGEAVNDGNICHYVPAEGEAGMMVAHFGQEAVKYSILKGSEGNQIQGWVSYRYGEKLPAPVLSCRAEVSGSWSTAFVIWPNEAGSKGPEYVRNTGIADEIELVIGHGGLEDFFHFCGSRNIGARKKKRYISTDSGMVFGRRSMTGGSVTNLFATGGTALSVEGLLNITGMWNYIEIYIDSGNAFLAGDIQDSLILVSDFLKGLEVPNNFRVTTGPKGIWSIQRKR